MRVVLAIYGSRGDVQPALALAIGLRKAGHDVLLSAPPNFGSWVSSYGVPFLAAGRDAEEVLRDIGFNLAKMLRTIRAEVREQYADHAEAMRGADAILGAAVHVSGRSFAELYDVPYFFAAYAPQTFPSRSHPIPLVRLEGAPEWANALTWRSADAVFGLLFREGLNAERARLGLPPIRNVWNHMVGGNLIYAGEPALSPLPNDVEPGIFTSGSWALDDTTEVDGETDAFIRAGSPPVYIGFGSMPDERPDLTSRIISDAVQRTGVRALVSSGWAKLGSTKLPESIRVIGPSPHNKLFPRLSAVVHHGGAGTTTASCRAGVPQVVVPHAFDQYKFGERVHQLGLAPAPIRKQHLTADRLANALRTATTSETMRTRAAGFAKELTSDGVQRTVRHIESVVTAHKKKRAS